MNESTFNKKLSEAFFMLPTAKKSKLVSEAKELMKPVSGNKEMFRQTAKKLAEKDNLIRSIPQIHTYQLIGRASIARLLPNATMVSMAKMYMPYYRGEFFFADNDTVSKRTYRMIDLNDRQMISISPPLGGSHFEQPWLITCPPGGALLNLEQALNFIQLKTSL